ncbi:MAG: hypothetical protein AB7U73_02000 [Pirellulales bacterium]
MTQPLKRPVSLAVGDVMFAREFVWHLKEVRRAHGKEYLHVEVWHVDGDAVFIEHDVEKILARRPDYAGSIQAVSAQAQSARFAMLSRKVG